MWNVGAGGRRLTPRPDHTSKSDRGCGMSSKKEVHIFPVQEVRMIAITIWLQLWHLRSEAAVRSPWKGQVYTLPCQLLQESSRNRSVNGQNGIQHPLERWPDVITISVVETERLSPVTEIAQPAIASNNAGPVSGHQLGHQCGGVWRRMSDRSAYGGSNTYSVRKIIRASRGYTDDRTKSGSNFSLFLEFADFCLAAVFLGARVWVERDQDRSRKIRGEQAEAVEEVLGVSGQEKAVTQYTNVA
ncbi:hypothetical protein K474DRAFT_1674441 [Panus rudis PR-1116 ss-1]|nr:hypothetical protein K474DRAFT_1674441 [Panus rudis PR-1116 ss-1]